jgi:hypothetical protein
VRLVGALLALAVAAVHVADQGGVTAFNSPDWIGWGYRMIEVGGVLTALARLGGRRATRRRSVPAVRRFANGGGGDGCGCGR